MKIDRRKYLTTTAFLFVTALCSGSQGMDNPLNLAEKTSQPLKTLYDSQIQEDSLSNTMASSSTFTLPSSGKLIKTAIFALPVVVAQVPDQTPRLWYPSFICAKIADTQYSQYWVNGTLVNNNFVMSNRGYVFPPYNATQGYTAEADCSYDTWSRWLYTGGDAGTTYKDPQCTPLEWGGPYRIGQPYFTSALNDRHITTSNITVTCVQALPVNDEEIFHKQR